ncbi:Na/Pi cotransporter family protein [Polycladomyces sp. WAk]|uniref:Na/Pi cotransporter family protein n=1 Tax=Polycladomyces zharkentensis TaxID=2807616 RepID=A0ABS2WG76_9BACL|nr:Na/Pi symporter [Polycladomyces sp. WAk]MBN2908548.1 Na/Pi cotransporter family protein [Polycladomyces sp. WAk]
MRELLIPFATGLTIFLFGLQLIRLGLETMAGRHLQSVLLRFTKTPFRSFVTGIVATGFLQSSSAVTVLTIGFVNAGLMNFTQTVGLILGTNIGTTVTTEILALKIEDFALPMIISGAVIWLLPWKRFTWIGVVIGGFGCIFLGMNVMQWLAVPLKEQGWMTWLLSRGDAVQTGLTAGFFMTAIIQSSSATIAMAMGFFASGLISLPFAVAVVLGSNVGTCITGLLAVIGANRAAKQVAVAHLLLNVGGVLLFAPFISPFADWVASLSAHPATQVAHAQTLFNIICSLIMLPFTDVYARFITRLIPSRDI